MTTVFLSPVYFGNSVQLSTLTYGTESDQRVEVFHGDSLQIVVPVNDADGNPMDLTGATAKWWVTWGALAVNGDAYLRKGTPDTADGGLFVYGSNLEITLTTADTAALQVGAYYH